MSLPGKIVRVTAVMLRRCRGPHLWLGCGGAELTASDQSRESGHSHGRPRGRRSCPGPVQDKLLSAWNMKFLYKDLLEKKNNRWQNLFKHFEILIFPKDKADWNESDDPNKSALTSEQSSRRLKSFFLNIILSNLFLLKGVTTRSSFRFCISW